MIPTVIPFFRDNFRGAQSSGASGGRPVFPRCQRRLRRSGREAGQRYSLREIRPFAPTLPCSLGEPGELASPIIACN